MDCAPDLVIDLTGPVPTVTPKTAPADPLAVPRWRTEARYTPTYSAPPKPREKRPALPGLTILPDVSPKRSRLDVRALLRHA